MSTDTATGLVVLTSLLLLAKIATPDMSSEKKTPSSNEASYADTVHYTAKDAGTRNALSFTNTYTYSLRGKE